MPRRPLTILQINKYFFVKGGSERYLFGLRAGLAARGHRIVDFAMHDPRNEPSPWARFFVSHASFGDDGPVEAWRAPFLLARAIYSREAFAKMKALLHDVQPDIAHLHMIDHQISPSILSALRAAGVPIVQTQHQYKAVCPNYRLYDERRAAPCTRCVGTSPWHAVTTRCHRGSLLSSTALAIESSIHQSLGWLDMIDRFHAPSEFMAGLLVRGGIDRERIRVLRFGVAINPVDTARFDPQLVAYAGRLSPEKGVTTLIAAAAQMREYRFVIAGDGSLRPALEQEVRRQKLTNVTFVGHRTADGVRQLLASAAVAVVPSVWFENAPLAVYEALAVGTPVVGARIGGIPEIIDPGRTGELFEAGNPEDLEAALRRLLSAPNLAERRAACLGVACGEFDPQMHLARMEDLYYELTP